MKSSGNWRVLIDCSTFISGALYSLGKPREILRLWQEEKIKVLVSREILKEYERKIRIVGRRMKKDSLFAEYYLHLVETEGIFVTSQTGDINICRDPNDLKYLEAAKGGEADFLISSDRDLLVLKKFWETKIVNTDKFLRLFAK